MFYNTTSEVGVRLQQYRAQSGKQDAAVLDYFLAHPSCLATPFEVQAHCAELSAAPVTSVRRALTNLTHLGFLEKTAIKHPGPYGRPSHCWRLAPEQPELF